MSAKTRHAAAAEPPQREKGGANRRAINSQYIERVRALILSNRTVRRILPSWGRLHIDRQLPFLFVYRRPGDRDDSGTDRLIVGEASFLTAPPDKSMQPGMRHLVTAIAKAGAEVFGAFLIVELWSTSEAEPATSDFSVREPGIAELEPTIETLMEELRKVRVERKPASVESAVARQFAPPGRMRLLTSSLPGVYSVGLAVRPFYRSPGGDSVYPTVLRTLHKKLSVGFRKTAFRFTRTLTTHRPKHFHALGRQAFSRSAWEVDRRLAEIGESFDFLLAVSPVNSRSAWAEFRRSGYEKEPRFLYPHLGIAPGLVKRKLYAAPLERIEDPEISAIFRQKQDELDRQLTGLLDRGTPRFMHESMQIFGGAEPDLVELAETILDMTSAFTQDPGPGDRVGAEAFAARAREEIDRFRKALPQVASEVRIRDDINGLMVSRGNLLIPRDLKVSASRLEALIQHEVGTHVLTYINGRAQPFKQLYTGLAGYDALQEGIAVLSEYLVGGLSHARLRLLAARVVTVRAMLDGATFIEAFRILVRRNGFSAATAFTIAMRVFRGGGLTKDAAYLRGLVSLLNYLRSGGAYEPLLVGKVATEHVPVVQELLRRKALRQPPLKPSYLADRGANKRLEAVKRGMTVLDLIKRRKG